jgi:hypothetical protein
LAACLAANPGVLDWQLPAADTGASINTAKETDMEKMDLAIVPVTV